MTPEEQIRFYNWELSHWEAEAEFRSRQQPLRHRVEPELVGCEAYGDRFAVIVYRGFEATGLWPTMDRVLEVFSEEKRYDDVMSRKLFAAELDRLGSPLLLRHSGNDWVVEIHPDDLEIVRLHFHGWALMDEQLDIGRSLAAQGDPDPFGVIADREYHEGRT